MPMKVAADRDGDARDEQFESLVLEHQRSLYQYIRSMVSNVADADEVFQEANLAICRSASDFAIDSNFRAWAFRIAFHRVLKYRERKKRECLVFSDELIDVLARDAYVHADLLEARSVALASCLAELRPRDRDLIKRWYDRGATGGASSAKQLGRTLGSIYMALSRIRKSLMWCISRRLSSEGVSRG